MAWWFDGIHELDRESIPEVNKHWSIKPVLLQYWAQFSFLAARKKKNKQKKTRNETVPFHLDAHFSSLILINFFWVARLKLKKAVSDLFQSYFNQSLDYGALLRLQGRGFWPQKSILAPFLRQIQSTWWLTAPSVCQAMMHVSATHRFMRHRAYLSVLIPRK